MKLYTEEQVIQAMILAATTDASYNGVLNHLTPIQLPTDEEINEFSPYVPQDAGIYFGANKESFIEGAKWMRDQILKK